MDTQGWHLNHVCGERRLGQRARSDRPARPLHWLPRPLEPEHSSFENCSHLCSRLGASFLPPFPLSRSLPTHSLLPASVCSALDTHTLRLCLNSHLTVHQTWPQRSRLWWALSVKDREGINMGSPGDPEGPLLKPSKIKPNAETYKQPFPIVF